MLFELKNVSKHFGRVTAVDQLNLNLRRYDFLGIAGESGSGKSTLCKMLLALQKPSYGQILYKDIDLHQMNIKHLQKFRKEVQLIFQNPFSALNPQATVIQLLKEPLVIHQIEAANERLEEIIDSIELPRHLLGRYPCQLSGGQCQRVAIGRALACGPEVLVCDEPFSALDSISQEKLLHMLCQIKQRQLLTIVLVSHDLGLLSETCETLAIMYQGKIVEMAPSQQIIKSAQHPYTQLLFRAALSTSI